MLLVEGARREKALVKDARVMAIAVVFVVRFAVSAQLTFVKLVPVRVQSSRDRLPEVRWGRVTVVSDGRLPQAETGAYWPHSVRGYYWSKTWR